MPAERWSYQQIVDPQFLESLLSVGVRNLSGRVTVELSDGTVCCGKRMAFLNLFWWPILTEFNIPICKRHFIKRMSFNKEVLTQAWNFYYFEVMDQSQSNADRLKMAFWDALQRLYKFTCTELYAYAATIDILDMAEIMTSPKMKEILDTKEQIKVEWGTNVIEEFIDTQSRKIMDLMGSPGELDNEALLPYQSIKQLNKFQVPQTVYAFGVRTDVDDTIIPKPVIGSAVDGLRDAEEYAIESLSAKKAIFYNKMNVPESQYLGRKQHLIASSIRHIYPGDCGSTALVDFHVTKSNFLNVIGKNIVDNGVLVEITEQNVGRYIDQTVHMRSPMTCRYRNGVCEVCGGRIISNLDPKINIGILAAIHVIEKITQMILSSKHLIKTKSLLYILPKLAAEVLFSSTSTEIRWRNEVRNKLANLRLGVPLSAFNGQIEDINTLRSDKEVKEEGFSSIPYFVLMNSKGDRKVYPLASEQDAFHPFFSSNMLFYIRDHFSEMTTDDELRWIPLAGTDKFPIFKTVVTNDNMLQFVNKVTQFLGGSIANYTSCAETLRDLSEIIYRKVSTNIVHIEILLKAYQVVSMGDYTVPRVTDPDNVMFQNTSKILNYRHVGVECGFQDLKRYISNPATYLVAKSKNPFDLMIGYEDY